MRDGRGLVLLALGAATAVLASMCGIGGGLFAVPLLHYVRRLPLRRSVATSLVLVCATAMTSTVAEVLHADSALRWGVVAALLSTSLVGAQLGYRVARRLDARRLKVVFAVVLLVVGARVLLGGAGGSAGPAPDGAAVAAAGIAPAEYALVALFGLLAGFVAPLLGIGGGLVAVPALFLGVPALGYLGARAASLGMGAVTSARSLWMYARDGDVDFATGGWLAAGAVLGSALGVWTVHLEGAVHVAQALMGVILWLVAARFTADVWRARRAAVRAGGEEA